MINNATKMRLPEGKFNYYLLLWEIQLSHTICEMWANVGYYTNHVGVFESRDLEDYI